MTLTPHPPYSPDLITSDFLSFFPKTPDTVKRKKFNDITMMQSKSQDPFAQFKYCTSQNTSTVAQFHS
jgi:hypothetical protein